MNKLDLKLKEIKNRKRMGLMTHVVVGYPSLVQTIALVKIMEEAGADIVELQIPFSDPLADGPTIMKACEKSLENGTRVKDAFNIMQKLSKEVSTPLLFMAYFNTVFKYGVERFCKDASLAGATGLIVPDVPIEEEDCERFIYFCKKYKIHNIRVLSPASNDKRLKINSKEANGFIYCTARQGITGVKEELSKDISLYLGKIRKYFSISIAVGFGISKKEHIKALKGHADIAVIGSAIIDIIDRSKEGLMEKNVRDFIAELKMVE